MARSSSRGSGAASGKSTNGKTTRSSTGQSVDRGQLPVVTGPIGAGAPIEVVSSRREFPVAQPVEPELPAGMTPLPEPEPGGLPIEPLELRWPLERPELREHRFCFVQLPQGCYQLTVRPNNEFAEYRGTLRVDKEEGPITASGDLYRYPRKLIGEIGTLEPIGTLASARLSGLTAARASGLVASRFLRPTIPIHPISRYHSYLKVTGIRLWSMVAPGGTCTANITAEQYLYTQPPAGSFNGTFTPAPGANTIRFSIHQTQGATLFGPHFEGTYYVNNVAAGAVYMQWVSKYFRKCTVEIDTLTGSVAPQAVPAHPSSRAAAEGKATEDFRTMMASAGWDARIEYDQRIVLGSGQ